MIDTERVTRARMAMIDGIHDPDVDVNVPLLRKAVEWVETEAAQPIEKRRWRQDTWISPVWQEIAGEYAECGTAYCVAGYVGAMLRPDLYAASEWGECDCNEHVSRFAQRELGLNDRMGDLLFAGANNPETIRAIAEIYAGGPL